MEMYDKVLVVTNDLYIYGLSLWTTVSEGQDPLMMGALVVITAIITLWMFIQGTRVFFMAIGDMLGSMFCTRSHTCERTHTDEEN